MPQKWIWKGEAAAEAVRGEGERARGCLTLYHYSALVPSIWNNFIVLTFDFYGGKRTARGVYGLRGVHLQCSQSARRTTTHKFNTATTTKTKTTKSLGNVYISCEREQEMEVRERKVRYGNLLRGRVGGGDWKWQTCDGKENHWKTTPKEEHAQEIHSKKSAIHIYKRNLLPSDTESKSKSKRTWQLPLSSSSSSSSTTTLGESFAIGMRAQPLKFWCVVTTTATTVASLAAFQSTLGFRTCNFSRLDGGSFLRAEKSKENLIHNAQFNNIPNFQMQFFCTFEK